MKKALVIVGVVVALGAIIGMNVRNARSKAVSVNIVEVGREDLVAKVTGSGRVEARRSVSITSNVVGKVIELAVKEGDAVVTGDLILRIDPGERTALLEQARAGLGRSIALVRVAVAELEKARFERERVDDLLESGLASVQDEQSARTAFNVADARVASAREDVRTNRAGVDHAEYEFARTEIHAEMDGVIVRLTVEEGENVLAGDLYNSGSAIVIIADLSDMEVWILVDETEVVNVSRGQDAEVTVDAFPDDTLVGRVAEVANSAYNAGPLGSQEAQDFRVRIQLDSAPPEIRPGLSARAEVVTDRREQVLAVPIEALTVRNPEEERRSAAGRRRSRRSEDRDDDEESEEVEGVFVEEDGVVRFVEVETGIAGERHFEVVTGLEEGAHVVRGPFDALRHLSSGDKVKVTRKKRNRRSRAVSDANAEDADAEGDGDEAEESTDVSESPAGDS